MAGGMENREQIDARLNEVEGLLKNTRGPGALELENEKLKLENAKLKLEYENLKLILEKAELKLEYQNLKLENQNLKLENQNLKLEAVTLSTSKWLDEELPKFPLLFGGTCGKASTKPRLFPKTVKKWENFEEAVRSCTPVDTGVRHSSQMLAPLTVSSGDNEAASQYCFQMILRATLIVHGSEDCSVETLSTTSMSNQQDLPPAEKNAEKLAKTSRFVPDLVLRKGSLEGSKCLPGLNEFLVAEMKRPTFLRHNDNGEVPDLVRSYDGYKTSGGLKDDLHGLGILQLLKYMVNLKLGYAVLSTADISYFFRLVKGEEDYDCLEISQGITWCSRDPTLKRALYYVVHIALEEMDTYKKFQFGKGGAAVIPILDTDVMEESEEEKVEEDEAYCPSNTDLIRSTRVHTRRRGDVQESAASDLQEDTPASDLNLEETPFATGGWSGNVVRGRFDGQPVAVKLAPKGSDRGKALEDEGIAYKELRQYWGKYLPKLIAHGTTVHGTIVYIATELIDGSDIGLKPLTQAVARAARSALRAVHNSGWVHGDIREENILVVEESVRLIDFGFAKPITSTAECDKEVEELEEILKKVDY